MNERFLSAVGTHTPTTPLNMSPGIPLEQCRRSSSMASAALAVHLSTPHRNILKYSCLLMAGQLWANTGGEDLIAVEDAPMYANSWHNYGRKFCTLITRWWQCTCGWVVAQWWMIRTRGGCKFHTLKCGRWPVGGSLALDGRQSALLLNLYLHNVPWIGAPPQCLPYYAG